MVFFDFQNNVTVAGVPVPSRVNLQSFLLEQTSRLLINIITASYRRDGTSRFTESNRWQISRSSSSLEVKRRKFLERCS
jgi:hypothetical protein